MLITMFVADKLEVIFFRHLRRIHVTVLIQTLETVSEIRDTMKKLDITLSNLEFEEAVENKGIAMTCFLRLKHRTHHQTAIDLLESVPGVLYVELLDI